MANALDYASWFIQKNPSLKKPGFSESVILQKQLFFAQMVYMAINENKQLFEDNLYAYNYGPVVESVRKAYNSDFYVLQSAKLPKFTQSENDALDITYDIYGNLDATELSELSHYFPCWVKNHKSNEIERQNIEDLKIPTSDLVLDLPMIKKVITGYLRAKAFKG